MTTQVPTLVACRASPRSPTDSPPHIGTIAMAMPTSSLSPTTPLSTPLWLWATKCGWSLAISPICSAVGTTLITTGIVTATIHTTMDIVTPIGTIGDGTRPTGLATHSTTIIGTSPTTGITLTMDTHTILTTHTTNRVAPEVLTVMADTRSPM